MDVWRGDGGEEWMCGGVMEERSARVVGRWRRGKDV